MFQLLCFCATQESSQKIKWRGEGVTGWISTVSPNECQRKARLPVPCCENIGTYCLVASVTLCNNTLPRNSAVFPVFESALDETMKKDTPPYARSRLQAAMN